MASSALRWRLCEEPAAITSQDGALLAANEAYRMRFDAVPPLKLPADEESTQSLLTAVSMAWRDGAGCVAGVATLAGTSAVEVQRAGLRSDLLLWRYPNPPSADPLALAVQGISGITGERLTRAGVLAALVDSEGRVLAANKLFADRAIPAGHAEESPRFSELVDVGEDGLFHLPARGRGGRCASGGPCSGQPGAAERVPGRSCCSTDRKRRAARRTSRRCSTCFRSVSRWSIATAAS